MEENATSTRTKGKAGEEAAAQYLLKLEYRIIARNYQARNGEIDIIAEDPRGALVFIEVKSSRGRGFGHPFYRVTKAKQKQIASMARRYLAEHRITSKACRFDVVAVMGGKVQHLKNAFYAA